MSDKRMLRRLVGGVTLSLTLTFVLANPASSSMSTNPCTPYARSGVNVATCQADLITARLATARYRNVLNAVLDGYVPMTDCVKDSMGAMGEHWARVDRLITPSLDPAKPAILLYEPTPTGRRLVAVEYEASALENGLPHYGSTPPNPAHVSAAPRMFGGKLFNGPMQGHTAPQPWHYDLHVWIWAANPNGVFAQYNPTVHC